jgi:hypothetical protein
VVDFVLHVELHDHLSFLDHAAARGHLDDYHAGVATAAISATAFGDENRAAALIPVLARGDYGCEVPGAAGAAYPDGAFKQASKNPGRRDHHALSLLCGLLAADIPQSSRSGEKHSQKQKRPAPRFLALRRGGGEGGLSRLAWSRAHLQDWFSLFGKFMWRHASFFQPGRENFARASQ